MKVADPLLADFYQSHPDFDLTTFDFIADQAGPGGTTLGSTSSATPHLRSYQRLLKLTDSQHLAYRLRQCGFHSAQQIAKLPSAAFVARLGPSVEAHHARQVHARACDIKAKITHLWANLVVARPGNGFNESRACSVDGETLDEIRALPSYQDMFGNQNFCQCEACASIFGPAAYYVDIMRITDRYVSTVNASTIPSGYRLRQRRPTLFTLPLSCASTNDLLPYLSIVNANLSEHIAQGAAVTDVANYLATTTYPFATPDSAPLRRVRLTLGALDLTLATFYASTRDSPAANPDAVSRESLGLSNEQAAFTTTVLSDTAALQTAWGLRDAPLDTLDELATFSRQSGLSRQQITELTVQGLSAAELDAGLAHQFWFNLSLPSGTSVQIALGTEAPDTLDNLDPTTLDAINRYIRLSQWSGIDVESLGHALHSLAITELNTAALGQLAAARGVVQSLDWSWARASSLWSTMPTTGRYDERASLSVFDTVWNSPEIRGDGRTYHPRNPANPLYDDEVIEWRIDDSVTNDSAFNVSRLRAGLGLDGADLVTLAGLAFPNQKTLPLSVANLSTLYRDASLAAACRLSIAELGHLAGWLALDLGAPLPADTVALVVLFSTWQRQTGLTTQRIAWFLSRDADVRVDDIATVTYGDMQVLWSQAAGTLLTPAALQGDSIDAERALAIYAALLALTPSPMVEVGDAYRSQVPNSPPGPAALVPALVVAQMLRALHDAPLALTDAEIDGLVSALNGASQAQTEVLNSGLAGPLDASAAGIAALGQLIAAQPGAAPWITSLLTPSAARGAQWQQATATLGALVRLNMACTTLAIGHEVIAGITTQPSVFGIDLSELFGLATLRGLQRYRDTRQRLGLTDASYLAYLAIPADDTCQGGAKAEALCRLTGWPQDDLCGVIIALAATPALYSSTQGLSRLAGIFAALAKAGFDASAYQAFLASRQWPLSAGRNSPHWQDWQHLADTCEGAAAAHLGKAWSAARDALQPQLLDAERNTRMATLLWLFQTTHPEITNADRLSGYLLLDVQMGGSHQTSLVVEATGAVQMYLNRARANLEPGIEHIAIPEVWWEWLTTYRMWEANRKVFLYPENYLVPTLRSSASSLFRTLESDLTQVNITPERVTTAYRGYIKELDRLASLQFIDAFHCTVVDRQRGNIDTHFQFARTSTEPYEYHWTKQELGASWSQWSHIDVTIKSPYVTPVYAFGRLFVFWVETSAVSSTAIETQSGDTRSKNSVVFKAAIRFSYMDSSGNWVTDQTLSPEQVIYATPNQTTLSTQSGYDIFNMQSLFWQKCNVQVFSRQAPIGPNSDVRLDEKIVVLYGPFLENSSNGTEIDTGTVPSVDPQRDPAVVQFDIEVFRRSRIVNQAIASNFRGVINLRAPMVLNRELQRDYLYTRTEFLNFLDNYSLGVPPTIRPLYDYTMNRLYARPTLNVFRNNYYGDWNNSAETTALRHPVTAEKLQFSGVNETGAKQIVIDLIGTGYLTTRNNTDYVVAPGYSDNADFRFLLGGSDGRDDTIIRQWTKHRLLVASIDASPVTQASFRMTAIDATAAGQALASLQTASLVTEKGFVAPTFDSTSNLTQILVDLPDHPSIEFALRQILFIAMGDPTLIGELANRPCSTYVVKNQPSMFVANVGAESYLITPNAKRGPDLNDQARVFTLPTLQSVIKESFITRDISLQASEQAFDSLVSHSIIDAKGRLIQPFHGDEDLSFLFPNDPAQSRQIKTAQVRVVLIDLPSMTAVSYYAENNDVIISATSFARLGISNAQSKQVFDTLTQRHVIGPQGMISPTYDPDTDLNGLFPEEPAQRAALMTADVALILQGYFDNTWRRTLHDLYYRFARLTTGAVPRLTAALEIGGVDALLNLTLQQAPVVPLTPFASYDPGQRVMPPPHSDATQVDFHGVYGIYFWELFFFTPRLIADALLQAGDYASALLWLQYIFNPTQPLTRLSANDFITPDIDDQQAEATFDALRHHDVINASDQVARHYSSDTPLDYLFPEVTESLLRLRMITEVRNVLFNHQTAGLTGQFWRFQPFRNHTQQSLLETLTNPVQIATYNRDPYDPYAIAQLRIGAFEKATFCTYIDVLIGWGDRYFQRKTRESLNAAYLLYAMAKDLLGERPEPVGPCSTELPVTFEQILERYGDDPDDIPQFLIDMENLLATRGGSIAAPLMTGGAVNEVDALFCVPHNDMLLARWDRVDDRLFKIRNSLDLDGNPLLLPLFAAPIDPMALVRAAAASGSNGGFAPLAAKPPSSQTFRFTTLVGNARAAVGDLQILGGDLEQALTMHNSETLQILQSTHEQRLDQAQLTSFTLRSESAQATLEALRAGRAATEQRRQHYADLIANGMNAAEMLSITFGLASRGSNFAAIGFETGAAIASLVPQAGSPFAMTYGGKQLELASHRTAGSLRQVADVMDAAKELSDTAGQFQRVTGDWKQQQTEAANELIQIDEQIAAAEAELASAKADATAHQVSLSNASAQLAFLESKFDNPDYYAWRVSRVSALYYQAYQLALASVEATQSSLQWNLASSENFLSADPWDSAHRGLMAANSLNLVLDRMEFAYSQKDTLRQEITKEIFLSHIDPAQLVRLRAEGVADIQLSEALFDFDFPSQYCRRIKTLEVSLLPVDEYGIFEEVHALITQTNNKILRLPTEEGLAYMLDGSGDPGDAVWQDWRANQTVSLSRRALADGAFIEYVGDGEKLQRFEGTGAVSRWRYELPKATNQFDFSAIDDLKLTLRYTALNGGATYRARVEKALTGPTYVAALLLNMVAAYDADWRTFIDDTPSKNQQTLAFSLSSDLFPPHTSDLVVNDVIVALAVDDAIQLPASAQFMTLTAGSQAAKPITSVGNAGALDYGQVAQANITGSWRLTFDLTTMQADPALSLLLTPTGRINEDALLNVFFSVQFTASTFT
ncbi:Tc toxin subunit A-related protein [Halomonas sp. V046]|uniref:Tc toxin subunit A-related protein n=1 Tax=Halomonas sp. V046 TaxID=3459611 RepID=UPI004043DEA1